MTVGAITAVSVAGSKLSPSTTNTPAPLLREKYALPSIVHAAPNESLAVLNSGGKTVFENESRGCVRSAVLYATMLSFVE